MKPQQFLQILHNTKIQIKLIAAFLFFAVMIGGAGGSGILFVDMIDEKVTILSDVASPLVDEASRLVDGLGQMHVAVLGALEDPNAEKNADALNKLKELDAASAERMKRLGGLASKGGLSLSMDAVSAYQKDFVAKSGDMLAAHHEKANQRKNSDGLREKFEKTRAIIDSGLGQLTNRSESAMGEMEDSGKTLALDSDATIADFSVIMADTFDRAYPMVKDTYRIRGYLTKMQNTLAAYVVETEEKELKKLDKKFKRFLKKAKSLPRRLMGRAQSEEDKAALKSASDGLAQLEKGIFGKAGLFASYQQSLAADRRADSLKAELETVAENFEAELATVVEKAQTLSAGAKQSSKDVVAMAVKSIAFVVAGGVALALVLGVLISRGLSKPLGEITVSMRSLADGDRSITVMHTDRKDEIGELAGALQVFKENAIEAERLRADAEKAAEAERQRAKDDQMRKEREAEQERQREAEKIEAERHQQKAQAERAQRIDDLNASFDDSASTVLESVTSSAAQMKTSAEAMTATAEQTNTQSVTVATAAEQASSKVQTVATAAEELSPSINEIGRQVEESSKIASDAVQKAQKTDEQVQGLASAAQKIGEVVGLITDIAEQTNLLALNATIEAARAGDAGKGFAVVASEVKNLATQTANATDEIGNQIGGIQVATQKAVDAIQDIGKTIGDVNEIATSIASAVEEQSAATQEIARNVQQAAKGTDEVTTNISGVTKAAGETGQAASEILEASSGLSQQAEALRNDVRKYLAEVKAA